MASLTDLAQIRALFTLATQEGLKTVLATVVSVQGSSYRRPGARMLITERGEWAGTVSGGCLEADVVERARAVMASNIAVCVSYDTTADIDVVLGYGSGCRGVIRILLQPLSAEGGPLAFLTSCLERRRSGVLGTLFQGRCHGLEVGDQVQSTLQDRPSGPSSAVRYFDDDVAVTFAQRRDHVATYVGSSTPALIFWEFIKPPPTLLVCGAGNDAQPVVALAKGLGWRVEVLDGRPGYLTESRFPLADALHIWPNQDEPPSWMGHASLEQAAVLMTHHFTKDLQLLPWLLSLGLAYVGVLGPKTRTERLLGLIGLTPGNEGLWPTHLYAPVGLDIGAQTPETIALSMLSEIQAVLAGYCGGHLRERTRAIHQQVLA